MALAGYLADTSALARLHHPAVDAALTPLIKRGLVATTGVVAVEFGYTARSPQSYRDIQEFLDELEWLDIDERAMRRARAVQSELAEVSRVRQVGLTDLLIAAIAEQNRVAVLHYDSDFDAITEITGQPTEWVVPRGTVS